MMKDKYGVEIKPGDFVLLDHGEGREYPNMNSGQMVQIKKIGSKNEVNSAPVDNIITAIDTEDIFIEWKNKIQCIVINIPPKEQNKISLKFIFFLNRKKIKNVAIISLYQTNEIESNEMRAPRIEVKPQIKTKKWRPKTVFELFFCIIQ